jgi:hypothetical protein
MSNPTGLYTRVLTPLLPGTFLLHIHYFALRVQSFGSACATGDASRASSAGVSLRIMGGKMADGTLVEIREGWKSLL